MAYDLKALDAALAKRIEEKNVNITGLSECSRTMVTADYDLIGQVVYNLLDNAIKFSAEGETISLSLWRQNNKAYVSIKNRGDTIPADQLGFIFDRFHKTDKSRSQDRDGVGLGLYIVKTIIKKHGGVISVSSIENRFTAFEFTLPINR